MVYKKYITRDGKVYGPYIYESKRINGKVVSQYHGPKSSLNVKRFALIFVSAVFVIGLFFLASNIDFGKFTGSAIFNPQISYSQDRALLGNITLSLKQGELLPASSSVLIENSGQKYEFSLDNLVSDKSVSGDFYLTSAGISGKGKGYGMEGEAVVYPRISFVLEVPSASGSQTLSQTSPSSNEVGTGSNETPLVNETSPANESVNVSNANGENVANVTSNISIITPTDNQTAQNNPGNITTETGANATGNTASNADTGSNNSGAEVVPASPASSNESSGSPITGFFAKIYSLFLGLTPTGRAIQSNSQITEISGVASYNEPFVYNYSEGEVKLKPGSVIDTSTNSSIPDSSVSLTSDGQSVIVTTSYSQSRAGFGSEFLGNETKEINVNLSSLGLVLNDGELNISVVYDNTTLMFAGLSLSPGKAQIVSNVTNETGMNVSIVQPNLNQTNLTNQSLSNFTNFSMSMNVSTNGTINETTPPIQIITSETAGFVLTDDEKNVLKDKFGDAPVEATQRTFNGQIIWKYELGSYWVEYSYNPNTPQPQLDYQISLDRMKWLKDLAYRIKNQLAESNSSGSEVASNYSIP